MIIFIFEEFIKIAKIKQKNLVELCHLHFLNCKKKKFTNILPSYYHNICKIYNNDKKISSSNAISNFHLNFKRHFSHFYKINFIRIIHVQQAITQQDNFWFNHFGPNLHLGSIESPIRNKMKWQSPPFQVNFLDIFLNFNFNILFYNTA